MAIETKDDLLAALAGIDEMSVEELAQLAGEIEAAEAAMVTAGDEYNDAIAAADEAVAAGVTDYNNNVQAAVAAKDDAVAAADEATVADASDEIAAIGIIVSPTLASNSQADIQAALDNLAGQLNARLTEIKAMGTALNNPTGTAKLKEAVNHTATGMGAMVAAGLPPAEDTQPEIDEHFAFVDGLRGS